MKRRSKASLSSDDESLAQKIRSRSALREIITTKELKRPSRQACEFCDKKFKNMYNYMVHNSTHIIIPLLKNTPEQCSKCKEYFLAAAELADHMSAKHNTDKPNADKTETTNERNGIVVNKIRCISDRIKFEDDYNCDGDDYILIEDDDDGCGDGGGDGGDDTDLNSSQNADEDTKTNDNIPKDTPDGMKPNGVLKDFLVGCKVDVVKLQSEIVFPNKDNSNICSDVVELSDDSSVNAAEAQVDVFNGVIENAPPVVVGSHAKTDNKLTEMPDELSDIEDLIILMPKPNTQMSSNSVHHNDLIRPGVYFCKRCSQCFTNRYQEIIHETGHLTVSVVRNPKASVPPCPRCRKPLTEKHRHKRSHRSQRCQHCGKLFWHTKKRLYHEAECTGNKQRNLKICADCRLTVEDRHEGEYTCLGKLTDLTKTRRCHWCNGQFQRLWVMGQVLKRKYNTDGAKFERNAGKGKAKTNHERLKMIQQRLKLMNK